MKNYEEIKDIIINKLGIKDQQTYKQYLNLYHCENPKKITIEDIELLSPDNINNHDFWKVVEEIFGVDCVANIEFGQLSENKMDCNRRNLSLSRTIGGLNLFEHYRSSKLNILEIGAGYGCFKNWIETNTYHNYTGVDVFPKIDCIETVGINGLLTDVQKTKKYDIVYSSNVFQHLSHNQRISYLDDIFNILENNGFFVINLMLAYYLVDEKYLSEDGKIYLKHYGQFTEIPKQMDWINELSKRFQIIYTTIRNFDTGSSKFTNFVCSKLDKK